MNKHNEQLGRKMPVTIWIANEAGHPGYEKALEVVKEEATLKPLTIGNVNTLNFDRLTYELARGVARYVNEDDYLIFSGTAIIPAIALLLWVTQFGECKILQWKARDRTYQINKVSQEHVSNLLSKEMTRI